MFREATNRARSGIVAALAAAVLAGCGAGGDGPTTAEGESVDEILQAAVGRSEKGSNARARLPSCRPARPGGARSVSYSAPARTVQKGEELTAVVRTNCGSFSIALDTERSAAVVNSFVFLARNGFYDGVPFDVAGAGRYLHGGDPPGKASGPGYAVRGKIPPGFIYRRGVVAMSQPGQGGYSKAGSQFFVVLAKPWLDFSGIYPPLGTVTRGFDVLDDISQFGPRSNYDSNPGVLGPVGKLKRPVVIESISIEEG